MPISILVRRCAHILSPGFFPFFLAVLFSIFSLAYVFFNLPQPADLAKGISRLFEAYGIVLVFGAAFIENLFMLGVYFPGSLVVLVAILVSDGGVASIASVGFFAWLGFSLALPINYLLGSQGLYRALLFMGKRDTVERMQGWLEVRGQLALFMTAIHPNILSIAVVSMGVARRGLASSVFWSALYMIPWLVLMLGGLVLIKERVHVEDGNHALWVILALVVWGGVLVLRAKKWREYPRVNNDGGNI